MRLVFLGTPAFAVPTLERVVAAGHTVLAVVTQPDRPRGRGQNPAPSPVKQAALSLGLPVYQPERVRRPEAVEFLRGLPVDAMVVVGYGQIIPQSIIDMAPLGIINVHGSLLPRYRGAGPVQWAILNGETRTGVTTMRIDAGLDTGDMLLKAETAIGPDENAVELGQRLAVHGRGSAGGDAGGAGGRAHRLRKAGQRAGHLRAAAEEGRRPHRLDAATRTAIHNQVRGLQPWPGAYTTFRGQALHIWRSRVAPATADGAPGSFASLKPPVVRCGTGALELVEVQLEGRKRMAAADFANGQRLTENETLGDSRA